MTELVITRGLPASGKTIIARQWVAEDCDHRVRINRDDMRQAMYGRPAPLPHSHEEAITVAQRAQVTALLRAGVSVIVDDMHLRAKYGRAWADLARSLAVDFRVIDVPTDVDTCIARDAHRGERSVGEQVIRDLARRFHRLEPIKPSPDAAPTFPAYVPNEDLPAAWIVDMDGTLACRGDHDGVRDWYDDHRVEEDTAYPAVVQLVRALAAAGYAIVIMSGRTEAARFGTERWRLREGIPASRLFMRAVGDTRKDDVVKHDLFVKHVAPAYNVVGTIDDRNSVVAMWRQIGLTCAQVAPGDF